MLPFVTEGNPQEERNVEKLSDVLPEVEAVESCELLLPSWAMNMRRQKRSPKREKVTGESSLVPFGMGVVANWS